MLAVAATPSFKRPLRELIQWYELQLKKLGVEICFQTEIDEKSPELADADEIIVAVGSSPIKPDISCEECANLLDVTEAHVDRSRVRGEHIVIAGGGLSGCDFALELAMEGKNVTIVEMLDRIGGNIFGMNLMTLNRLIQKYKINAMTSCKVIGITKAGVKVLKGKEELLLPADTVVTAFGCRPNQNQAIAIREAYPEKCRLIGDCAQIGKVGEAVREGFYAGFSL